MRKRIRRINAFQTAKVTAVLYAAMGLLVVPFIVLAGMFGGEGANLFGLGAGLLGALLLPALYAVIGYIFTLLACALYNVVAGMVGGIEFEVEDVVTYGSAPT